MKLVVYGEGTAGFAVDGYARGGAAERLDMASNPGNSCILQRVGARKMEVGGRTYDVPKPKVGSFSRSIFLDEFIGSNESEH
jgi:hypothetical protein